MATTTAPRWVDWDKLDAPISGEKPEGESLRYEGTYDKIEDARRRDNPNLELGVWETELKQADWDQVIQLATQALETRTKDLQIATWLMEAWVYKYRFEGVRHGLEVLFRLCDKFWSTAYPQMEGEDLDARVRPFEWINTKLNLQLKLIPLSQPRLTDQTPVTYADYEKASFNENEARKNERAREKLETEMSYSRFFASCDHTPPDFYRELAMQIQGSRDRLRNLEGYLDDKCGKESPSLLNYRETLKSINRLLDEIRERQGIDGEEVETEPVVQADTQPPAEEITQPVDEQAHDQAPEASGAGTNGAEPVTAGAVSGPPGKFKTRQEAYRTLSEIADFLERTEPHSPTPHLIRRAVSWGNMTLDQLLLEIVRDENDLRFIYDLLGLGKNTYGEDDE